MVLLRLKFLINGMTFDIDIVNFPFLDGDVPRSISYGVNNLNLFVLFECPVMSMTLIHVVIVVVVLLFYVYGKHLRSCREYSYPNHTFPGQA